MCYTCEVIQRLLFVVITSVTTFAFMNLSLMPKIGRNNRNVINNIINNTHHVSSSVKSKAETSMISSASMG